MEYNKINIKQRIFLYKLSDIYNYGIHEEKGRSAKWKTAKELGFISLHQHLNKFDEYVSSFYRPTSNITGNSKAADTLHYLLHWAHGGVFPFSPYHKIHINSIRKYHNMINTLILQIDQDAIIRDIDKFIIDSKYIKLNPLWTNIDVGLNKQYLEHLRKLRLK